MLNENVLCLVVVGLVMLMQTVGHEPVRVVLANNALEQEANRLVEAEEQRVGESSLRQNNIR